MAILMQGLVEMEYILFRSWNGIISICNENIHQQARLTPHGSIHRYKVRKKALIHSILLQMAISDSVDLRLETFSALKKTMLGHMKEARMESAFSPLPFIDF